jgi:transcriptional regulator with XRE-family HTH domain
MNKYEVRNFLEVYGQKIKALRVKAKLTQLEVAKICECSQAIISHIECGYMLPPPHIEKSLFALLTD